MEEERLSKTNKKGVRQAPTHTKHAVLRIRNWRLTWRVRKHDSVFTIILLINVVIQD
jgi:hypothetical protein